MNVAVVVLNWNGFEDTLQCINSLVAQDYVNFSIVVVDNGSLDSSLKQLSAILGANNYHRVHVIYNEKNLGFAGGVNTGISYALENSFDAIALLNNDATVDRSWLTNLAAGLQHANVDISTGLLLREDGRTIDTTGECYSIWGMPFPSNRNHSTDSAPESGFVFSGTGGATLYKREVFEKIGLFDESFFAYYEDVDISFRAQLAGFKVYYTNKAIAYHKQGATSSKIPGFTVYQTFKNIPLLFTKNVPLGLVLPIGLRLLLLYWLIFANAIKNGNGWPALKGWLASIWLFWTRSVWQRIKIQRSKKVSTAYITSLLWHDLPPDQTGMRKLLKRQR